MLSFAGGGQAYICSKKMVRKKMVVNVVLLASGVVVSVSGFVLQVHYHLIKSTSESAVFRLNRAEWNGVHVYSSIVFLCLVIHHLYRHRKCVRGVVRRRLFAKNRPTILLSLVAVATFVTGLIALFSIIFIEIHDKVALLFFILAFGHTIQRKIL